MTPFNREQHDISSDEINRITALSPIREKAFFTIMRQSGLKPNELKKLRIKDLKPNAHPPYQINVQKKDSEPPVFIGREGARYIMQYLATKEVTTEDLLFSAHNNPKKEINTKDVSRTFRVVAEKLAKEKGKTRELRLFDLVKFYRNNSKHYLQELEDHPIDEDEFYRALYRLHAMPFLEIENHVIVTPRAPKKWFNQRIESQQKTIDEQKLEIAMTREQMGAILSLFYDNKGNWETGENVKLGNNFIKLWQKAIDAQLANSLEFLNGQSEYIPPVDVLEELTKTLQKIIKSYRKSSRGQKQTNQDYTRE